MYIRSAFFLAVFSPDPRKTHLERLGAAHNQLLSTLLRIHWLKAILIKVTMTLRGFGPNQEDIN
jgi:hypothetical protein